ncbi:hypothetical protein FE783_30545 [Paenibacillus mesophilus]|uniref:hypothetical protein n=1 Tax=Paenibacillus mesophilus TaxID=2582849 RepID=UPI00110DA7E5|nr:hypothetical protein [Paenibacillus mesophilus]TMV45012.1 hypothetical protein FE783_30545 [Paenibacillus mesophilus]
MPVSSEGPGRPLRAVRRFDCWAGELKAGLAAYPLGGRAEGWLGGSSAGVRGRPSRRLIRRAGVLKTVSAARPLGVRAEGRLGGLSAGSACERLAWRLIRGRVCRGPAWRLDRGRASGRPSRRLIRRRASGRPSRRLIRWPEARRSESCCSAALLVERPLAGWTVRRYIRRVPFITMNHSSLFVTFIALISHLLMKIAH